jgi:hypothetical protein
MTITMWIWTMAWLFAFWFLHRPNPIIAITFMITFLRVRTM